MRIKIILLFSSVMLIQAAILGVFIVNSLRTQLMDDYRVRHQQMTDLLSCEIEEFRKRMQTFSIIVLGDRRLQDFLLEANGTPPNDEIRSIIRVYMNYAPHIRGIYLADTDHYVYSNTVTPGMHSFIAEKMPYLEESAGWSSSFSEDTVIMYRRVNDLNNLVEKIGALFIIIDRRAFMDLACRILPYYQLLAEDFLVGHNLPQDKDEYTFFHSDIQNWQVISWIENSSVYRSLNILPPMLLGGFGVALLITAVPVFIISGKLTRILIKQIRGEEMKRKALELKTLQYQINPHFLYNTLDCVNMLARKNGTLEISQYVTALSNLFRLSLNHGQDFISVSDEFEHMSNYLKIQSMRFPGMFNWSAETDQYVDDKTILKFLLQPLVENSLNHGLRNSIEEGMINISAKVEQGVIRLEVRDNGTGMTPDELAKLRCSLEEPDSEVNMFIKGGFGLRNVHRRLKLYYGDANGLVIESEWGEGTVVKINIPEGEEHRENKT